MNSNILQRRIFAGQVVLSSGSNTWIVMWVHGSTKHCKENTLKYMGGGNLFSVMILLNYGCVLPNGTAHYHILQCSTVLLVNPNPFLNSLVSPYPLFTAECGLNFIFSRGGNQNICGSSLRKKKGWGLIV